MNLPPSLEKAIDRDRVAHAYLFYGRRNHRYGSVVRQFFSRLVCDSGGCGDCQVCRQIRSLSYPDMVTVNPPAGDESNVEETGTGRIGVDQVRERIVSATSLTSSESSYKLFWLNDMVQFTEEASNTLLKVLEEPPGDTVFVLTARSLGDCLPTIRSRCQWVRFQPDIIEEESVEATCQSLWPDENWDTGDFETWSNLLKGERRSSNLDWNTSNARGFLTMVLVMIHRKYTGGATDEDDSLSEPLSYELVPDILERIDELDRGGNPEFTVNSLLERIHFPGETNECRHVI